MWCNSCLFFALLLRENTNPATQLHPCPWQGHFGRVNTSCRALCCNLTVAVSKITFYLICRALYFTLRHFIECPNVRECIHYVVPSKIPQRNKRKSSVHGMCTTFSVSDDTKTTVISKCPKSPKFAANLERIIVCIIERLVNE